MDYSRFNTSTIGIQFYFHTENKNNIYIFY